MQLVEKKVAIMSKCEKHFIDIKKTESKMFNLS